MKKTTVKSIINKTISTTSKLIQQNLHIFENNMETQLFNLPAHRQKGFSNASMVVGLIPWFEPDKKMVIRDGNTPAKNLDAEPIYFEVDDIQCSIIRRAAIITARHGPNKGKKIVRFPSEREFDVLEALQLIGTHEDSSIGVYKSQSSIRFTLPLIRRYLHNKYNNDETQEALEVLNSSKHLLRIKNNNKIIELSDAILPIFISGDQAIENSMKLSSEKATHLVILHPLITSAISNLDMHQINSSTVIESNSLLVRYLRKRLALRWTQASITKPYTIKASTLLESYGYNPIGAAKKHFKLTARPVTRALSVLSSGKNKIISHIHVENIFVKNKATGRKKIIDYRYNIYPTESFISIQKRSLAISDEKRKIQSDATRLCVEPAQMKRR